MFDAVVLLAIVATASLQYVGDLGTYTDSWNFIANLVTAPDQSLGGLYRSLAREPNVAVRPPQIAWYILFDKLSPGQTQAAHIASHALFAAAIVILYAALRRMAATREGAFVIALLYACGPQYVAARMWYAAHQAILALLFFAVTLLLVAIYADGRKQARSQWLLVPIAVSCTVSCLAYELFAFVLLAVPLFVWCARGERLPHVLRDRRFWFAMVAVAVPVVATSLYKISFDYAFTVPQSGSDLPRFVRKLAGMYARLGFVEFATVGILAPWDAVRIATGPFLDFRALAAAVICAAMLAIYGLRRWPALTVDGRQAWFLAASGLAVFVLAYLPLSANFYYNTTAFGDGTRIHIAGALGVALVFYAGFRAIERRWRGLGAALLAIYALAGIFIQVSVGSMWADAYLEQNRRYAAMKAAAAPLSERDTLLLYGACPYYGSAPVFYTSWGFSGRLRADPTVEARRGDVLTPASRLDPDALVTVLYGAEQRYPYRNLVVFDIAAGTATRIDSRAQAHRFFAAHPLSEAAPCRYREGGGAEIYGI